MSGNVLVHNLVHQNINPFDQNSPLIELPNLEKETKISKNYIKTLPKNKNTLSDPNTFNESIDILESAESKHKTRLVNSNPYSKFSDTPIFELSPEYSSALCGRIYLNIDINPANYYGSLLLLIIVGLTASVHGTLEPQWLMNELEVDKNNIGKLETYLYLIDYGYQAILSLVYGFFIDLFGRKKLFIICVGLSSAGFFLIPLSTGIMSYISFKCLVSGGFLGMTLLPLQHDYVHNSYKGISAGIFYTFTFIGASTGAAGILIFKSLKFSTSKTYFCLAIILASLGIITSFLLKGGNTYYLKIKKDEKIVENSKQSLREKIQEIKTSIKTIPWIPMAIIGYIPSASGTYLITVALILWLKRLGEGWDEESLSAQISKFQLIISSLIVITSIIYGFIIQRVDHFKYIISIVGTAAIGFITLFWIDSPDSPWLYVMFCVEGVTLSGLFIFSTFCMTRYSPPRHRGVLNGFGNIFGILGAVIILVLGGILYDNGVYNAGFIVFASFLIFCLLSFTIIYAIAQKNGYV